MRYHQFHLIDNEIRFREANDLSEIIEQYCGTEPEFTDFFYFKFHSIYTILPGVLKYTEIIETSKAQI